LVKTKALLLRDLPFITRISKLYDFSLLDNSLDSSKSSSSTFRNNKSSENHFGYRNDIKDNSHLNDTINTPSKYDDDVMTLMQAQIPKSDTLNGKNQEEAMNDEDIDKLISPAHWETIRKLRELQD
jgi:hypothetical protein